MKTAIYVRVSTEEQAKEGYSISGQMKRLKAFCISQEWTVADIYLDEGISAKNMERPELKRMMSDIKKGKIKCVLVYRLDRLTRSVFDLYKLLEQFEKYDCKFKSATEVYDTTTAMGRMFITIVAALAQWERENMGERISFGLEEKARQGKIPMNFAPIGYDLNKKESKLYINKKEARIVRTLFEKYVEGLGSNRLCQYLNNRNLLTKKGNYWSNDTVFKVLKSPIHKGSFNWNGIMYKDTHEPIVSKELWNRAQELLKERKMPNRSGKAISSPYLFSSVILCDDCGNALTGNYTAYKRADGVNIRINFYRCRHRLEGRCDSKYASLSEVKVEDEFIKTMKSWNFKPYLEAIAEKKIIEEPEINEDLEELEAELKKLDERKKKWQYAWSDDLMDHEDFKNRMNESNSRITEIKNLLKEHEGADLPTKEFSKKERALILKDIDRNWDKMSVLEKKNMIYEVVEEIKIERIDIEGTRERLVKVTDIIFK